MRMYGGRASFQLVEKNKTKPEDRKKGEAENKRGNSQIMKYF